MVLGGKKFRGRDEMLLFLHFYGLYRLSSLAALGHVEHDDCVAWACGLQLASMWLLTGSGLSWV